MFRARRTGDRTVSIATDYGMDDMGIGVLVPVAKNCLFSTTSRPTLRHSATIQWVPTGWALCPGLKRPGREADHSPATSTEVKKTRLYIFSRMRLHGVLVS
jgi:hypothetical protein